MKNNQSIGGKGSLTLKKNMLKTSEILKKLEENTWEAFRLYRDFNLVLAVGLSVLLKYSPVGSP